MYGRKVLLHYGGGHIVRSGLKRGELAGLALMWSWAEFSPILG